MEACGVYAEVEEYAVVCLNAQIFLALLAASSIHGEFSLYYGGEKGPKRSR
jgi:hypothetical protein